MNMEPSLSLPLIEQHVNPRVWADGKSMGQAQNAIPVVVKLKDPHLVPQKKQHPLKPEAKEGLKPIIEKLKEQRLLIPSNSPSNTPILGIKKSNGKWRLAQDLRIINEAVVPLKNKSRKSIIEIIFHSKQSEKLLKVSMKVICFMCLN